MNDIAIENCRLLDAQDVVERLGLAKDKERHKWACPACGSSDGLHVYPGPGRGSCCFAGCGRKGFDAIGLVQLVCGLDFVGAVKWLAAEFGFAELLDETAAPSRARRRLRKTKQKLEKRRREKARLEAKARRKARDVYDRLWPALSLGPIASEYLSERAIPPHVAEHVGIRSVESDAEWHELRLAFWPPELDAAGLTGRRDGDEYPVPWRTPFLVVPYWLEAGGIDTVRFRDLSGHTPKYLSPLGHRPTVAYQSHAAHELADDYSTLYICEGELNALSVTYAGAPSLGSCGNGVWESAWSKPFRWWQQVVVLCDGDEPGIKFSQLVKRATADALGRDWTNRRLKRRIFTDGIDANDALIEGHLEELVRAA